MSHYKPEGYTSVAPYLVVEDARATLTFLEKVFGAAILLIKTNDEGRIRHAEVRVDDTVIMLADRDPSWPAIPAHVHIYVPDVDAAYENALKVGATSVQEPNRKSDADRRCGVKDSAGTTWWIATMQEA